MVQGSILYREALCTLIALGVLRLSMFPFSFVFGFLVFNGQRIAIAIFNDRMTIMH